MCFSQKSYAWADDVEPGNVVHLRTARVPVVNERGEQDLEEAERAPSVC